MVWLPVLRTVSSTSDCPVRIACHSQTFPMKHHLDFSERQSPMLESLHKGYLYTSISTIVYQVLIHSVVSSGAFYVM